MAPQQGRRVVCADHGGEFGVSGGGAAVAVNLGEWKPP
jgi:hypothetical protein